MKGFFSLELLLIYFLLPNLLYLIESEPLVLPRETEVYAQDAAQIIMYGFLPKGSMGVWVDEKPDCDYEFLYCTKRLIEKKEVQVCAAECLP